MTDTSQPFQARGGRTALAVFAGLALLSSSIPFAAAQAVGRPPPDAYAPAPASSYAGASVRQDRIEELEAQVAAATAENERLQYELMQSERELTRLRNMVGELADTNTTLQDSIANPAPATGAPAPLNGPATGGASNGAISDNGADARARATGTLGTLSANDAPAPQVDSATAFQNAQTLLLNNRAAQAEVAFEEFLTAHGDSAEAPDARYWYAFTLLSRNDYDRARGAFVDFLQRHPQHARAPEAQVRLGMALVNLDQTRLACAAFRDLPRAATRAVRDLAARESRAANCPA
jgi:TolA-binding protein